jgi:hypothetical protein
MNKEHLHGTPHNVVIMPPNIIIMIISMSTAVRQGDLRRLKCGKLRHHGRGLENDNQGRH